MRVAGARPRHAAHARRARSSGCWRARRERSTSTTRPGAPHRPAPRRRPRRRRDCSASRPWRSTARCGSGLPGLTAGHAAHRPTAMSTTWWCGCAAERRARRRPTLDRHLRRVAERRAGAARPDRADSSSRPPPLIQHSRSRALGDRDVSFVRTGYNTDRVTQAALARARLDYGCRRAIGSWPAGEIESRQESFGGIGSAVMIATFLILAVLVLEFRTFRSTLIVASVIPLGVVGRHRRRCCSPGTRCRSRR